MNEADESDVMPPRTAASYAAAAAFFVPLFGMIILVGASYLGIGSDGPYPVDADDAFHQMIGWRLPLATQVFVSEHTHGGLNNDGDLTVIVQMSPQELAGLIASDDRTWHNCPVAPEIKRGAWHIPAHSGTIYYAEKTRPDDDDWHRGHVVIAEPESGMVWLYHWKM